jgi:protein gp37
MADNTNISWASATWNPITGCAVNSPGCKHCYAMRLAGGRLQNHPSRRGLTRPSKAGPVWTGETRFNEAWEYQPLQWRHPRHIFVCAHSDLFGETVPDEWIDRVFAVMALAPQHLFLVLTKRPDRMHRYLSDPAAYRRVLYAARGARRWRPRLGSIAISDPCYAAWWPQVWLGTTIEDQKRADGRRPHLQALFLQQRSLVRARLISARATWARVRGYRN